MQTTSRENQVTKLRTLFVRPFNKHMKTRFLDFVVEYSKQCLILGWGHLIAYVNVETQQEGSG
jgi:hypothetical protein